jgi:hypothetical protein
MAKESFVANDESVCESQLCGDDGTVSRSQAPEQTVLLDVAVTTS